jgi:prevent-host-death family protein
MTYSVHDARKHFGELLERVRSGERVVISEQGREVAEVRSLRAVAAPVSTEEAFRQLEEEGIISPASEHLPSLAEVLGELEQEWRLDPPKPGGLKRFLESRG